MTCLHRSVNARLRLGVLCLSVIIFAGCGAAAPEGETAGAQGSASAPAGETTGTAAAPSGAAASTAAPAAAPVKRIAAPTAEQIAKWTPAPFEPVQLLAIREWEKTSFTARMAATPDGKHFIVAGSRVLLWSLDGDEPEHVFLELTGEDGDRRMLSLAVAPDGKWFAAGDSNGMVRIWSLEDRKELVAKDLDSNGVTWIAISPDGKEIATIAYDTTVSIWNAADMAPKTTFDVGSSGIQRIEYMAPSMLAVAGETTSLWNTSTAKRERELSPGRYTFSLARSPDGSQFIFGGDDVLHLWDVAANKETATISHGVSGSELLAISLDGKFLATTDGRSVALWNLAERRLVQPIDGFGWTVVDVRWLQGTNLLAVASDEGVTRIWGTTAAGAAAGLKPLHRELAMPDAASKAPATPMQLEQVIDMRTLPRLPGSELSLLSRHNLSCTVPASADEVNTFYKYFLEQQGWKQAATPSANPGATEFRKNGFMVALTTYDAGEGKLYVSLDHGGNYDLRWTPKYDAAPSEILYEAENTVSYRVKAGIVDIETWLLRKLRDEGWAAYSRLHTSHAEEADERDFTLVRKGTTLRVSIGKFPDDKDSYTVQYSLFLNNASAPVPPDAGFVEFDGSIEPSLVAITTMTLDEARKFYDDEMTAQGWLTRERGESEEKDRAWLYCVRQQCNVSIGFTKLPDGKTLVQVGDTGGSLWELSQTEPDPESALDSVGLEAADFPDLTPTKTAKFDALAKTIELQMDAMTLAAAAEQYIAALASLGWKPEEGGFRDEDYTLITFAKDEKEITLRARPREGNAMVSFEGDGLLWNKELPGGKQPVSYETWLRLNRHPPGLELLDKFEAEMRALARP